MMHRFSAWNKEGELNISFDTEFKDFLKYVDIWEIEGESRVHIRKAQYDITIRCAKGVFVVDVHMMRNPLTLTHGLSYVDFKFYDTFFIASYVSEESVVSQKYDFITNE